jgi:pimeloyl-ACP methyl ester carboxylesterase
MPEKRTNISVSGRSLEILCWPYAGEQRPSLIFLHEGLGAAGSWRDVPRRLAYATGCNALAYSRYGYGQSDVLTEPRGADYMHVEALDVLPEILRQLEIENPILYGHSDGASIALIHAGTGHKIRGLIVEAPHVFVEPISIEGITIAAETFRSTDLPVRLGRHHRDPEKTFWGWHDIWMSAVFRSWDITSLLPGITAATLIIQGESDAYGTMAQVDSIAAKVTGRVAQLRLPRCGHAPHREKPEIVLPSVTTFIKSILE